jgi:phosphoribosylanthranilate isomerase
MARGRAKVVALVVDPEDSLLADIMRVVAPDLLQLHGTESAERARDVAARFAPVMKAVAVAQEEDVASAGSYAAAGARVLFDAKPAAEGRPILPGGNGLAFDWRLLAGIDAGLNYMLAGGLNPDNVAEAIRLTDASAVDVSSGVESAPGVKDPRLIRRFLQAAKTAKQAP